MASRKLNVAKTLVSGSLFKVGAFVAIKGLSLVFYYLALRLLTPEEAGFFFVANAIFGFATTIPTVGIPAAVNRYVALFVGRREHAKIRPFFEKMFNISLFLSLALVALMILSAEQVSSFYSMPLTPLLWLTGIASAFFIITSVLLSYLDGRKFFFESAVVGVVQNTLKVGIALGLIIFVSSTAFSVMGAAVLGFGLSTILAYWIVKRDLNVMKAGKADWEQVKESMRFGIPYYLTHMAEMVATWTDTLFIGYFLTAPLVAAYAAVILIARNMAPLITGPIISVQATVLAESYGKKSRLFNAIAANGSKWMIYLGLPFAAGLVFYKDLVMETLFPVYADSSYLLLILLPAFFMVVVSGGARAALFAVGRSDLLMRVGLFLVIPNVVLNYLLIPGYGLAGAASATAVSVALAEALALHYGFKYAGARVHHNAWKSLAATALMCAVLFLLNWQLGNGLFVNLLIAGLGACVYFTALVILGGLSELDWQLVGALRKKLANLL